MVNVFRGYNQPDPVQAMYVNGAYLEELIDGYRTLTVEGREPLTLDLENIEIATKDGARHKRRRINSRTIKINFALTGDSPADFSAKYNALKMELYKIHNSEISFDDEPDKYIVGTYKTCKVTYPGRSASVGEIEIFCADPFKYAVSEKTATVKIVDGRKVLSANYLGTYPAHPVLEATCPSDNGFYGFVHTSGATLQFGDPEEMDTEVVQRSEMLVNDSFAEGVPNDWTLNDGLTSTPGADIMTGTWASCTSDFKGNGIAAATYGTGNDWHGPGLNKVIPPDSNSIYGSANFKCAWQWEWFTYRKEELSNMQFNILGKKNNVRYLLAGVELMDGTPSGHAASWRLWIDGAIVLQSSGATNITSGSDNLWAGITCGESSIQKSGGKIIFKVAGKTYTFENDAYEDLEALEITLYAAGHKTFTTTDHDAFFYVNFRKDAVDKTEDVPNMMMPGDVLRADTNDGSVMVNGAPAPELGALSNQWESFVLVPGENVITCAASTFASDDTYTMRYREVYL